MSVIPITTQGAVDNAVRALLDLLAVMAHEEHSRSEPAKWDDEYAGAAIDNCIDRLFCAPEARMPKPSEHLSTRYHEVRAQAAPFLDEDVPLPGSLEEDVAAREAKLWAERWPELGPADRPIGDSIKDAIHAEALRDAVRARE